MSGFQVVDTFATLDESQDSQKCQLTLILETFQKNYKDYFDISHISRVIAELKSKVEPNYAYLSYSDRRECSFHPQVCLKSELIDQRRLLRREMLSENLDDEQEEEEAVQDERRSLPSLQIVASAKHAVSPLRPHNMFNSVSRSNGAIHQTSETPHNPEVQKILQYTARNLTMGARASNEYGSRN